MKKFCIILTVLIIAGCTKTAPLKLALLSKDELQGVESFHLCNAYHVTKSSKIKDEIMRREIILDNEWPLIDKEKIKIGMSEIAFICSWGEPGLFGTINTTANKYRTSRQWVYRSCRTCKASYVYTREGEVTTIQN